MWPHNHVDESTKNRWGIVEMASRIIEPFWCISLLNIFFACGVLLSLFTILTLKAPFHFPKSVNISNFCVNYSMLLEPVPTQPLPLRNFDLFITWFLNKHKNDNIYKVTPNAFSWDYTNYMYIHCLYYNYLQLLNQSLCFIYFYTSEPRTDSRIWRQLEWIHIVWRQAMAFIFDSSVWKGLFHRHVVSIRYMSWFTMYSTTLIHFWMTLVA